MTEPGAVTARERLQLFLEERRDDVLRAAALRDAQARLLLTGTDEHWAAATRVPGVARQLATPTLEERQQHSLLEARIAERLRHDALVFDEVIAAVANAFEPRACAACRFLERPTQPKGQSRCTEGVRFTRRDVRRAVPYGCNFYSPRPQQEEMAHVHVSH